MLASAGGKGSQAIARGPSRLHVWRHVLLATLWRGGAAGR